MKILKHFEAFKKTLLEEIYKKYYSDAEEEIKWFKNNVEIKGKMILSYTNLF